MSGKHLKCCFPFLLTMLPTDMFRSLCVTTILCFGITAIADEPNKTSQNRSPQSKPSQTQKQSAAKENGAKERSGTAQVPEFKIPDDVREVLSPLFSSIVKAKVSRATVEMLSDSLLAGSVVESQKSSYQIASTVDPDQFTIYLKEPERRTRIYCDSKSIAVALAPDAYFRIPEPIGTQQAAIDLPVPMGPYPEPVLSLTLAGVDPAISFVAGMKSLEIVERKNFRGKIPAIHLRGVQADNVSWDFWVTDSKDPKPLRFLVDLTPMLIGSNQVSVPEGFSHQVRYDFLTWRVSGDVDERLFSYVPSEDATEYESINDYYESLSGASSEHPMLGKPAPPFEGLTMAGEKFDSRSLRDKVVVIDFWATWCTPCLNAMPIIKEVTDDYADKGVVFLGLNTGEEPEAIKAFLEKHELDINTILDPDGKIATLFAADAIPQTILVGKTGAVESVHIGFPGEEAMRQRLIDELDVLSVGGQIGSATADMAKEAEKESKPALKKRPTK